MKLSEAIRLGSMLGPQIFNTLYDDKDGSCALGAAMKAEGVIGFNTPLEWYQVIHHPRCPKCTFPFTIGDPGVIAHLNDFHRWTREQIADWVETIEIADWVETIEKQIEASPITEVTA